MHIQFSRPFHFFRAFLASSSSILLSFSCNSCLSVMFNTNPYVQAGWSDPQMSLNAQNSASNTSYWNTPPSPNTSLLGALPSPLPTNFSQAFSPSTPSPFVAFHFMECTPNITSSIVLGPQFEKLFHVVTNLTTPGFTVIQNGTGKSIAAIGWKPPAFVEMKGTVARQTTKQWLRLSTSGKYVTPSIHGVHNIG